MGDPEFHKLTVLSVERRTPNLTRVELHGASLSQFPAGCEGGYVKLLLPPDSAPRPSAAFDPDRAVRRTITIRTFESERQRLTLEFARHGGGGPAARWVERARKGSIVRVAGPGRVKSLDPSSDWFLLAGDMTALPAIAVQLECLPSSATGRALIEVNSEADLQMLSHPPGVLVHWLVRGDNEVSGGRLVDRLERLPWQPGVVGVWVACEFSAMRAIRDHLRNVRGVRREQMYISSYWKRGAADEEHKRCKAEDAEQQDVAVPQASGLAAAE